MRILKVASTTDVTKLAGAITNFGRDEGRVSVRALGAASVNQAVKAIATARGFLATNGIEMTCVPLFINDVLEDGERTLIEFIVDCRQGE
jgi:stage V sporulation protein S